MCFIVDYKDALFLSASLHLIFNQIVPLALVESIHVAHIPRACVNFAIHYVYSCLLEVIFMLQTLPFYPIHDREHVIMLPCS